MDHSLALTLFSLSNGEHPQDKYDEEIFRFKQFFILKPIVPKLFLKKINEMRLMHKAAVFLYAEIEVGEFPEKENFDLKFCGNWKSDYNLLQLMRTRFKQKVMRATDVPTIEHAVIEWMENEIQYIKDYSTVFNGEEFQSVIVSKEPDPMVLLAEMEALKVDDSIQNLILHRKELSELLQNELKRLNLLTQYIQ